MITVATVPAGSPIHERHVWLRGNAGPLAACYAVPPTTVQQTLLIVASLVEERKAAHPVLTGLARLLTARGMAVLRFDDRGCGDSPGSFTDTGPAEWQADLTVAAAWLRQRHPGVPHVWLGVRLGALRALQAAATAAPEAQPDGLVLWEPVTGPDFIRQLLQRHLVNAMLAYGRAQVPRRELEQRLADGQTIDLDGFAWSGRQAADLAAWLPLPWAKPALIVTTGPDHATADTCQRLAPAATRLTLRLPPFWNTVGLVDTSALTQTTADWLVKTAAATSPPGAPAAPAAVGTAEEATAPAGEQFISFPGARGTLRAVLHLPQDQPSRGRLVLLHGWSGDRTGPHRMFVHAARRLAAQGWTCLRLDFGGRGDSDGLPADATIATMTADTGAALAWLRQAQPAGGPLAILAICSGCKAAITAAAAHPDVARLVLWSAEAMGSLCAGGVQRQRRLAMLGVYARKLLRAETWRKLLRGRVRAGMVRRALVQPEVRSRAEARAEDAALRQFRSFGGQVLFVWGASDADTPGSSSAYERFCREAAIPSARHTVAHAGHSFYGVAWEHEVLDVTERWLVYHSSPIG